MSVCHSENNVLLFEEPALLIGKTRSLVSLGMTSDYGVFFPAAGGGVVVGLEKSTVGAVFALALVASK